VGVSLLGAVALRVPKQDEVLEDNAQVIDMVKCPDGIWRSSSELPPDFDYDWEYTASMRRMGYLS
jgi:hypothetical protein